jgi:L-ornithine N5-monooxygenase
VVGSGQNSAEVISHLLNRFPNATVHSIIRHSGFRLFDFGHFGHQVYWPEETDYVYGLSKAVREEHFNAIRFTNYSAIDLDVSGWLYRFMYQKRVMGEEPLRIVKRSEILDVTPAGRRFRIHLRQRHTGEESNLDVDVAVLCTGFYEPRIPGLLEPLMPYIELDEDGDPLVSRNFRVSTKPPLDARLYLSGITEWRHGINSATSFSTMALKAQELLDDLASPGSAEPKGEGPERARVSRAWRPPPLTGARERAG